MTRLPSRSVAVRSALIALFAAMISMAIACGGEAEPAATATPGGAQVAPATAVPAPTSAPSQPSPTSSHVFVARPNVGVPVGLPAQCPPSCGVEKYTMGAYELLLEAKGLSYDLEGLVAESWSMAPDGSHYIWNIRRGMQFHDGYGEVTAEDVAWSHNNANAATNPATAHDNAGDLRAHLGVSEAIDTYTVKMEITSADSRQPTHLFTSPVPRGVGTHSKAVFDKFGETGMLEVFVGSGPFEIETWRQDDRLVLTKFEDYWGEGALVDKITVLAVPEPAIRAAMFESGEVQISDIEPKDRTRLAEDHGGVIINNGGLLVAIHFAGQYLEPISAATGNVLDRPGYDPTLPWVADLDAPGCDYAQLLVPVPTEPICDQWESARLVRRALEISIDREGVNEQIYAGLATPGYGPPGQSAISALFKEEWIDPFDVEKAKQMLADAGYPNGLNTTVKIHAEDLMIRLGQFICSTWQELGLSCEMDQRVYAVKRPSYVDRSNKGWTFAFIPRFDPEDWPIDTEDHTWKEGGTQKGGNIPFSAITFDLMRKELDKSKRLELYKDWNEHYQYWAWTAPIVDAFNQTLYNGDVLNFDRDVFPTFGYAYTLMQPVTKISFK